MSDYEFIPIVYPNKEPNTDVPKPLTHTYDIVLPTIVPGMGLPFITSTPYMAPEPIPEPKPLPQTGVLVDPAGTLVYHPMSDLPATTTITSGTPMSTPPLISHFSGSEPLYAPYTSGGDPVGNWSTYPAVSSVDIAGNTVKNVGTMDFIPGSVLSGMDEISLTAGGFGSLTLNALGIQAAGDITGVNTIALNDQVLTAQPTALLLNGVPIATISDLPNIYQWANYPALSNVLMLDGFGIQNSSFYEFDTLKQLTSVINTDPVGTTRLEYDGNIICSTDLLGANKATGATTGVPQWATFLAIQDVNWNSKQITNINKITFNTAIPGLGNAAISAVNTIGFALTAGAATTAAIRDLNRLEFWNPLFPGVPGAQINLGTNAQGKMYTDVQFQCPNLLVDNAVVDVGPVAGANANWMVINNRPCPGFWSRFPATQALNMANFDINQINSLQLAFANAGPFCVLSTNQLGELVVNGQVVRGANTWSQFAAIQDVNFANFSINNMNTINFGPTNSLNAVGNILQWRGQPVATGAITPATWANFPAVNNVVIPEDYFLSINAENNLYFYKDTVLNTNVAHGAYGGHGIPPLFASSPDFISYPDNFEVGGATYPAREISFTGGTLGVGVNSLTELNVDSTLAMVINSIAELELGGLNIQMIGLADVTVGGPVVSITGEVTNLFTPLGELNMTSASATWNVGVLEFTALGTTINFGGVALTTGATEWTSGTITLTTPNLNVLGAVTNIGSAATNIASGITTITGTSLNIQSVTTTLTSSAVSIPTGKLNVNEIDAFTTDTLIIKGAKTITGAATGLGMTNVKSIAGQGTGVNITNIANFETYSATNVLLPCESTFGAIPNISLSVGIQTLVYASGNFVWNWTNIPFLSYAISITGYATITSVGSVFAAADPAYLSGYVVLENVTKPGRMVVLATPDPDTVGEFIPYGTTSTPNYTKGRSMFNITYNFQYIQDAYNFAVGDVYQIKIFMTNQLAPALTPVINLTGAKIQYNVHNAGAL